MSMICKICNPMLIGEGICAEHSTSGISYVDNKKTPVELIAIKKVVSDIDFKTFIKNIERTNCLDALRILFRDALRKSYFDYGFIDSICRLIPAEDLRDINEECPECGRPYEGERCISGDCVGNE